MHTLSQWFNDAETWLDARGKGAWIAAMILGFIFIWPVGLALLVYMIWSKRMTCSQRRSHNRFKRNTPTGSGNTVFDAYRDETLKRLEDEQTAFQEFLERLREAKDQTEFDSFMDGRRNQPITADKVTA